ncbi:RpiB/LacA/LacB family sugar-phosphate isomerase [Candidatus Woesearchaeota archaeon]|nr:RpiB/LacA/LacB family sugar-phosphate isomerase [Candidatus Woesearchaeota archaeon]
MQKIYLGADHAGFDLKEALKKWLDKKKILYQDLGNTVLDKNDDYPDFAEKVGMSIAANKVKGVRAVVPFSVKEAELSREHNDANVLCLSGWYFSPAKATGLVQKFLNTSFSNAVRHKRRLKKIERLEMHG